MTTTKPSKPVKTRTDKGGGSDEISPKEGEIEEEKVESRASA